MAKAWLSNPPRWLRWAYVAVCAGLLAVVVTTRRAELADLATAAEPRWLAAALALLAAQLALAAWLWRRVLADLSETTPYGTVLRATALGLPARYLPGGIWYPLGRAVVLARAGASRRSVAVAAGLEQVSTVAVSLLGGGAALALSGRGVPGGPWVTAAAVVALAALVASPLMVNPALAFVARRQGGSAVRLPRRTAASAVGISTVFWFVSGAAFAAYLAAFPVDAGGPVAVGGAYAAARGLGFLAVFAPQGAGVTEAGVAALLAPEAVQLAVLTAAFRGLIAVRDVAAFGVANLARRSQGSD